MKSKLKIGIVGAGPAGSFTAAILSKAGHEVVMFEKRASITRKICGEYLCPKGVDLLAEYGLLNELCYDFLPLEGMVLATTKKEVKCKFPFTDKKWNGLSLNRKNFDERLISLAIKNGTKLLMNCAVQSILKNKDGWSISTSSGEFSFDLLIAADGKVSQVAKELGHSNKLDTSRIAVHFYLPKKSDLGLRLGEMHIFPDGSYCGIDPINDNEVNVSFVFDSKKIKSGHLYEICNQYMKSSKRLMKLFGEIPLDCELKVITPLTNKNTFIAGDSLAYVGDAAGFIDPLTGEGIYNALLSGHLLVKSLDKNKSMNRALANYRISKIGIQLQKTVLNHFFQYVITKPLLCKWIINYIEKKQDRADYFIGIIGNVYTPLTGVYKMLTV